MDFIEYCLVLHDLDILERAQFLDFEAKGGKFANFMREYQTSVFFLVEIKIHYYGFQQPILETY